MRADHPLARAYRRGLAAAIAQGRLHSATAVAVLADDDFGLMVAAVAMGSSDFNPAFLREGPGVNRPVFSRPGLFHWAVLRDLGDEAIRALRLDAPGGLLVAVLLDPVAIDRARVALRPRREAA